MSKSQTTVSLTTTHREGSVKELRVEDCYSYLLILATRKLRNQPEIHASDIVQQSILEALKGDYRPRPAAQMAAWLRTILANNIVDEIKRVKRQRLNRDEVEEDLAKLSVLISSWGPSRDPSPSQNADLHERAVRLTLALARLPEAQRQAILLQYWQRYSLAEIAKHLERTPAAVAGLLHRGLKCLRSLLAEVA